MRNLNMSYNALDFDPKSEQLDDSNEFIGNMKEFLAEATFMNHINLSGMNLR